MKRAQFWANLVARLTRGAVPVDGTILPVAEGVREAAPASEPAARPQDARTSETEFDVAIFPRWGNFR